ncbi:MAG: rane protein, partial [Thermomicrobiales bacterium]|nr:rane protein [Thermomicrobiales bacterium]
MDSVIRAVAIYGILLIIFRVSGKRSLAQITTFDFVLLLIISEATQQALLGDDFSLINAFVVIITLIGLDIALSLLKQRSPTFELLIDDTPLIIVE